MRFSPIYSLVSARLVFFKEPSPSLLDGILRQLDESKVSFNHGFAGFTDPSKDAWASTSSPRPPKGFREKTVM